MKRLIVLFIFLNYFCAPVKAFGGDADQEKNYIEMFFSGEEMRLPPLKVIIKERKG